MGGSRISQIDAYLMVAVAVCIDVAQIPLQIVPFSSSVLDFVASIIFGMWFAHYDYSLINKRQLGFLGTIGFEFVPLVDMLPLWTIFVILTIRRERAESEGTI